MLVGVVVMGPVRVRRLHCFDVEGRREVRKEREEREEEMGDG